MKKIENIYQTMKTMKLKTPSCAPAKSRHGRKIQKLSLLLASTVIMTFASSSYAQYNFDTLYPYAYADTGVYPLPPIVGDWQETDNGVECQRVRTVEDQGCYFNDINDPYGYQDICQYPDHAFANSQVGVYVPGTGCTDWKSTSYVWVVGGTGSAYPTGSLVDQ